MKARVMMVGDYDEQSKTFAVCLLANEKDVEASGIKDGDEVDVTISNAEPHLRGEAPAEPSKSEGACSE